VIVGAGEQMLREIESDVPFLKQLYAPAGPHIGADTPFEVAFSIVLRLRLLSPVAKAGHCGIARDRFTRRRRVLRYGRLNR
jgi:hypothetical protein